MCFMVMLANNEAFSGGIAFLTGYKMMLGDWDMNNFQAITIQKVNATDVEVLQTPVITSFAIGDIKKVKDLLHF